MNYPATIASIGECKYHICFPALFEATVYAPNEKEAEGCAESLLTTFLHTLLEHKAAIPQPPQRIVGEKVFFVPTGLADKIRKHNKVRRNHE